MLRKKLFANEVVIYNFNVSEQSMKLLFRGKNIPSHLKEYPKLWMMWDKHRKVETIIISI